MCCLFWPALISLADEGIHNIDIVKLQMYRLKEEDRVLVRIG
jgi:hypothetical protein